MARKVSPERLAYKAAVAVQDWEEAARLVRASPEIFGTPPPNVPVAIAAVASDPQEPVWMIVEWSVQKNDCKGTAGCKDYLLSANQFDHLTDATQEQAEVWFKGYVKRRRESAPAMHQLGQTLYLLKVERIVPITDFDGVKV